MVKRLRPALVLMDITMPLLNGFQAMRQILKVFPATKIIILSAHSDDVYIREAVNCGEMGYLIKQTATDSASAAIRAVKSGNTFFRPPIPKKEHQQACITRAGFLLCV